MLLTDTVGKVKLEHATDDPSWTWPAPTGTLATPTMRESSHTWFSSPCSELLRANYTLCSALGWSYRMKLRRSMSRTPALLMDSSPTLLSRKATTCSTAAPFTNTSTLSLSAYACFAESITDYTASRSCSRQRSWVDGSFTLSKPCMPTCPLSAHAIYTNLANKNAHNSQTAPITQSNMVT